MKNFWMILMLAFATGSFLGCDVDDECEAGTCDAGYGDDDDDDDDNGHGGSGGSSYGDDDDDDLTCEDVCAELMTSCASTCADADALEDACYNKCKASNMEDLYDAECKSAFSMLGVTSACTPSSGNGALCHHNNDEDGVCISTSECAQWGGVSEPGHCSGGNDIQCCAYVNCKTADGICQDATQYDCENDYISGQCPGSNNFKCCTDNEPWKK